MQGGSTRYIVVIIVALVAVIAAVLAAYAYLGGGSMSHPHAENMGGTPSAVQGAGNCSLSVIALNGTAQYSVKDCTIEVESNDTFIVLWTKVPYRVEEGKLKLYIEAEEPVSVVLEYAPAGQNVTGSRIVFPVKDKAMVTVSIVNGAVDQVYMGDRPVGRTISPYILKTPPGVNLLKITLWGPLGVKAKVVLLGKGG